jgi:hypothetical protein
METNAGDVILFFEGDKTSDATHAIQIVKKEKEQIEEPVKEFRLKTGVVNRATMQAVKRMNEKQIQKDKASFKAKNDIWRGRSVQEDIPASVAEGFNLAELNNNLKAIKPPDIKETGRFSDLKIAGKSPLRRALLQ